MKIFQHWKTTSAGIVMCVGAVVLYVNDKTQLVEATTAFLGGIGFIFAGDATSAE